MPFKPVAAMGTSGDLAAPFAVAINQVRLYGCDHPVSHEAISACHGILLRLLGESTELVVCTVGGKLQVNSHPVAESVNSGKLAACLEECSCGELHFKPGLYTEELSALTEFLADPLGSDSSLNDYLADRRIEHIEAVHAAYTRTTENQVVVDKSQAETAQAAEELVQRLTTLLGSSKDCTSLAGLVRSMNDPALSAEAVIAACPPEGKRTDNLTTVLEQVGNALFLIIDASGIGRDIERWLKLFTQALIIRIEEAWKLQGEALEDVRQLVLEHADIVGLKLLAHRKRTTQGSLSRLDRKLSRAPAMLDKVSYLKLLRDRLSADLASGAEADLGFGTLSVENLRLARTKVAQVLNEEFGEMADCQKSALADALAALDSFLDKHDTGHKHLGLA